MIDCDGLSPFVSLQLVGDQALSSTHLYECLWCHYFRMRNMVTQSSFPCLFVLFGGHHNPIMNCHPFWGPITDGVYWTCMLCTPQVCTITLFIQLLLTLLTILNYRTTYTTLYLQYSHNYFFSFSFPPVFSYMQIILFTAEQINFYSFLT